MPGRILLIVCRGRDKKVPEQFFLHNFTSLHPWQIKTPCPHVKLGCLSPYSLCRTKWKSYPLDAATGSLALGGQAEIRMAEAVRDSTQAQSVCREMHGAHCSASRRQVRYFFDICCLLFTAHSYVSVCWPTTCSNRHWLGEITTLFYGYNSVPIINGNCVIKHTKKRLIFVTEILYVFLEARTKILSMGN
jgi:hypothetical protein